MKFKVSDKVRLVKKCGSDCTICENGLGKIFTIEKVYTNEYFLVKENFVRWDEKLFKMVELVDIENILPRKLFDI